jgi:hypothetical protein
MQAIRADVDSLRAEVECLSRVVARCQAEYESARHHQTNTADSVLRWAAAGLRERASDRVEDAASHLVVAASDRADLKREWDRTDKAVADLLFSLSKQVNSEFERLRAARAGASRHLVQAEKERRAIRRLRTASWWKWALQ